MRYVSSAYLQSAFPLVTACKSDASTTYDAGPIADPWMMLAELIPSRHPTNTVKALREMYNISSSRNLLGGQTNAGQIQQIAAEAQLVLKL